MDRTKISHVAINLIDKCNMNCKYCYHKEAYKSSMGKILPIREYIAPILDKLNLTENVAIDFAGGEVMILQDLLDSYLREFKKYERNHNVKFTYRLTTNGTVPSEIIRYIENGTFLPSKVVISYDGKDSDRSYLNTDNLKLLTKYTDELEFHIALSDKSIPNLYATMKELSDMGFRNIEYYYLYKNDNYENDDIVASFSKNLDMIMRSYQDLGIDMYNFNYAKTKKITYDKTHIVCKGMSCGKVSGCVIFPDGTFSPCANMNRYLIGDKSYTYTKDSSIEDIDKGYDYIKNFYSKSHCPSDKCGNYQCCECTLYANYHRSFTQQCKMRTAERKVFEKYM